MSRFLKVKKNEKEKGITLIALITTIIVLLILAGISIGAITGSNGIIGQAQSAKEETEIANEKEILEQAIVRSMQNNNRGNIVRSELQKQLDKETGEGETLVLEDTEERGYFVKFLDSQRIYRVNMDGEVEYLGQEDDLITQAEVTASPESNETAELIQKVELTVKTPIEIEGAEYSLVYAWSSSKDTAPEDNNFLESTLIGEGRVRKTTVYSSDTVGGDYYLWVRIVVGEIEKEVCFGPYKIRDHSSLVTATKEQSSTSGFLGNEEIERGKIESINITTSLAGHSQNDANTWDVSQEKTGKYLAWYEDSDNDGYYEVTIAGDGRVVANSDSSYLFANIGYGVTDDEVTITGLENLETGLVTNMSRMFISCKAQELDVSSFNTENVTNMMATFAGCSNVTELKVDNWNTSNVIDMGTGDIDAGSVGLFQSCSKLTNLNLSKWDTSNVVTMGSMFRRCSSLTNLDLSNFDTSNVKGMYAMFGGLTNLESLNLQNFDTSNVINMLGMFGSCTNLKEVDLSGFNTSKVEFMEQMFYGCSSLTKLNLSNFDTSKIKSMHWMFNGCSSLISLDISNFNTSNVTSMQAVFNRCSSLKELDLSSFNTSNVTNMRHIFNGCSSLEKINLSSFDTSNVVDMGMMFYGCRSLKELDVKHFNTSKATSIEGMFQSCASLEELDLSNFDTRNVTSMSATFRECSKLSSLDLSNFNTDKVTNMWYMFRDCVNIKTLNISNFNTQNVTSWTSFFGNIPTTIEIITNQDTKNWILEKFPTYTNITVVE